MMLLFQFLFLLVLVDFYNLILGLSSFFSSERSDALPGQVNAGVLYIGENTGTGDRSVADTSMRADFRSVFIIQY